VVVDDLAGHLGELEVHVLRGLAEDLERRVVGNLVSGLSISLPEPVSSVDLAEARRRAPGPVLRRLGEAGGS